MKYDIYYVIFDNGGSPFVEFFDNKDLALFSYILRDTYWGDCDKSCIDELIKELEDINEEGIINTLSLDLDSLQVFSEDIYSIDKKFCELVFEYSEQATDNEINILLAYAKYFYQNNIPQFIITQINEDMFEFYNGKDFILKIINYFDKVSVKDIQKVLLQIEKEVGNV